MSEVPPEGPMVILGGGEVLNERGTRVHGGRLSGDAQTTERDFAVHLRTSGCFRSQGMPTRTW